MKNRNPKNRRGAHTIKAKLKKAIVQRANLQPIIVEHTIAQSYTIPYDENLLEKCHNHWKEGEWKSLVKLDVNILEHHPDRAKLTLIIASAWQQLNDQIVARYFIKKAKDWGCDRKLIAQVLISDTHNTLGRAAALSGDKRRALVHFRSSIKGSNDSITLASQARMQRELTNLDLISTPHPFLQLESENTLKTTQFLGQQKVLQLMKAIHPHTMRSMKKIRVGGMNDGGYVVPDCVLKCDVALSIGVGNDVSFDLELANQGISVLQFDHTVDAPPVTHPKFSFEKKGWGTQTEGDFLDFNDIFSRLQLLSPKRVILKFDIEGAEYDVLKATNCNLLAHFDVIVCELHWLDRLVDQIFFEGVCRAIDKLTTHHVPVHLHANNCANIALIEGIPIPLVLEISFLRRGLDSFDGLSLEPIPSHLDRPNNPDAPDIYMTSIF